MTFHADEARKALSRMPVKRPKRLIGYGQLRTYTSSTCLREAIEWLHNVHGDPITGRRKRDIREELGLSDKDEEAKHSKLAGVDLSKLEAVIDQPNIHGTPLVYIDGLTDIHVTARNRSLYETEVVIRYEITGSQTRPLLGVPPSGRFVEFEGIIWLRFDRQPTDEGSFLFTCTDYWAYWDLPALMEQIGAAL